MHIFVFAVVIFLSTSVCAHAKDPLLTIEEAKADVILILSNVSSYAEAKNKGSELLAAGQFQHAYVLFMNLLREVPDDDDVNFGLGMAASGLGRHNQSIMAYERLLEKYPKDPRLYQFLANAYIATGDKESAAHYLERYRELGGNITPEQIETYLSNVGKRYELWNVRGGYSYGLLFDSNANTGPISDTMNLGPWDNVTISGAAQKSTLGVYLNADIGMEKRISQDSPWRIVADTQIYQRANTNTELASSKNRVSVGGSASAGIRNLSRSTLWELRLRANVSDSEFIQQVYSIGPEAVYMKAFSNMQLTTRAGVSYQTYSSNELRNGTSMNLGQSARFFFVDPFMGEKHSISAGVRVNSAFSKDKRYNRKAWELTAGLNFKLPYKISVSPNFRYSQAFYAGPATALEIEDRKDSIFVIGLSARYSINKVLSANLSYKYTNNTSTSSLYTYDQHYISVGISRRF